MAHAAPPDIREPKLLIDTTIFNTRKMEKTLMAEDKSAPGATGKGETPIMRVWGVLQEGEIRNENLRVYPTPILQEAVDAIQEDITSRALYGEYGHPENAKINMERISHLSTKARMDGRLVLGEMEILDNQPLGRSLRGLFERKCQVCTSSRSLGDVEELLKDGEKTFLVQEGLRIICWDMVADPSVRRAVMKPLNESRNRIIQAAREEQRRTGKLLNEGAVQNMILDAINKFFGIRDIGPRPKSRH
jgi:hypothetical protein